MTKQKETTVTLSQGKNNISLNYPELRKAVLVLRAINHTLRKQIIELLSENDRMAVTDIYIKLRIEQSVASQHLAILRKSDIVRTEREGKYIFYTLNTERLSHVAGLVEKLVTQ